MGVAPEEEAAAKLQQLFIHDVPSAEHTIGGGMKFGGQSSGVEMSGGPTEPTSASTTTAEHVFVVVSSFIASQTVAAANVCDAGDGGTAGADVMKAQELGSPQHGSDVGLAPEKESAGDISASGEMHDVTPATRYRRAAASGSPLGKVVGRGRFAAKRCLRRRLQRKQSQSSWRQAL